ncbi:MAG: glycerophosphodiester phosphodiesterase [Deltaproteobacteria bacterium]|nr:glycerophosphodiester phosphodiesterase [Candidatus Zymogenaceae bacterium]
MTPKETKPFFDTRLPIVFAHRGASGTVPENTIPAFEEAMKMGATYLETDVQITRDGVLVLAHDPHLGRTAADAREIKDLTFEELQRVDAGASFTPDGGKTYPFRGKGFRVPTLEEFLKKFKDCRANIEVKDGTAESARLVLDMLKKYKAEDRVLLASERSQAGPYIRREAPHIPTSASRNEVLSFLIKSAPCSCFPRTVHFDALQVPESAQGIKVINRTFMAAAKRLGVQVHVWTINDADDMMRLFRLGVDGIFTDFPQVGLKAAESFRS